MAGDRVEYFKAFGLFSASRLIFGGLFALFFAWLTPALATSVFDRETIVFSPDPNEVSFHERFNPAVERLSDAGGGTVKLEPGTYVTSEQLYVLSNIRLSGSGREGTTATILRLADNAPAFGNRAGIVRAKDDRNRSDTSFVNTILIEDIIIDGNRINQRQDVYDAEKKYGFYAEGVDIVVRRVTIHSCMGYGFDPHGDGQTNEPSRNILIENTHAYNNLKDGYALDRQFDMIFRNNLAEDNDRAGINVVTESIGLVIENSIARNNRGDGIVIQNDSGKVTIQNNEVSGNERHGLYIRDAWSTVIMENRVLENSFAGIRVLAGRDVSVERNEVTNNSTDQAIGHFEVQVDPYEEKEPSNVVVLDNRIRSEQAGAVLVQGNGAGVTVRDNVYQTLNAGIVVENSGAKLHNNLQMSF